MMAPYVRRLPILFATLALLFASITGAAAAPPQTDTIHFVEGPTVETDFNPCTGVIGTLTTTTRGVIHITEFTDGKHAGEVHITGTFTGRFEFVPDDRSEPTYTGRFTGWFGVNQNQKNFVTTDTFSVTGIGSDGSHLAFAAVVHFSVNANGDVTVDFDKAHCNI